MSRLIGLYSSRAQSGKSEVSKTLADLGWWNVKFAAPLKDMVRGLLDSMGFDDETCERMVEGDLKEQVVPGFKTVTPRHLMQTLGTDWGREAVDAGLWTKVAMMKTSRLKSLACNVVIDDLRYPNEYDAIKKAGGLLVRINRPDAPIPINASPRYEGLLDNHDFDVVIENTGTLEQLRERARQLAPHSLNDMDVPDPHCCNGYSPRQCAEVPGRHCTGWLENG